MVKFHIRILHIQGRENEKIDRSHASNDEKLVILKAEKLIKGFIKKTKIKTRRDLMKRISGIIVVALLLFTGCDSNAVMKNFEMEMDITEDYDDNDPFIDERLFYVTENVDELKIDFEINFDGVEGVLEIADNKHKNIIWETAFNETTNNLKLTAALSSLENDKEYVIRFIGYDIKKVEIVMTSESAVIKEREKPI